MPHRFALPARRPLLAAALFVVAATMAACGQDTTSVGSAAGPGGTTGATSHQGSIPPAALPGPLRGVAGPPIIERGSHCYGECAYLVPVGMPRVAVYDDGTVIVRSRIMVPFDAAAPRPVRVWSERRLTIGADEVAVLVELARRGGLAEGGAHHNGTTFGSADGGGSVFVARIDGQTTSIEAPHLYGADSFQAHTERPEERAQLLALQKQLDAFEDDPRATPAVVEQWALVARPLGDDFVGDIQGTPGSWGGTDLDALTERYDGAGCGVIADAALDASVPSMPDEWAHVQSGGRVWSLVLIPLLPHQHSCADLQAGLDDVRADELAALISQQ